ncbi:ABC transporter ATP-binding protein [Sulfuricurvum sp. IAE1]|jgi:putative ABC transport system ATP-binding protein|uniref:ABC transporter ATP-binding protein n=1 Tax=Sulfuricurvum sp. IAE1 TaxID=2546102 RepID=UPI001047B51A|nr:ABC transporter ATP-binding protein [Sulfuricurvum sp. IAE1]MDD3769605.1 ABC transporter ATP-binding protein [Sulfuricurvum sp.]MDX9967273.1 ABC transporter ATP-binding protein [Sulfuricurvum sp.]TDA62723.1 ABC transporter ATP-binding protein [Sulfuricurvum sp. IAE1]
MTLINATSLSHAFEYPLFEDISLGLQSGESIAIVGVSGSGKSTLMHVLSTMLRPNGGRVELFGRDIYALNDAELVRLRRHELGLIYQSHYLFKGFSAYENLEVAALLANETIDPQLLERLGIERVITQKVTELSGGQQQRVSIARVLSKKPRLIFADEPTGNLDHATAEEVMGIFEEYLQKRDAGMVLVTHDEALARRCTRVYRMQNGTLDAV